LDILNKLMFKSIKTNFEKYTHIFIIGYRWFNNIQEKRVLNVKLAFIQFQ